MDVECTQRSVAVSSLGVSEKGPAWPQGRRAESRWGWGRSKESQAGEAPGNGGCVRERDELMGFDPQPGKGKEKMGRAEARPHGAVITALPALRGQNIADVRVSGRVGGGGAGFWAESGVR